MRYGHGHRCSRNGSPTSTGSRPSTRLAAATGFWSGGFRLRRGTRCHCRTTRPEPEPDRLGERAALIGIARRDHRVVGRQAPALAVVVRRHVVGAFQMPLEHLQLPAILEADDVVGHHRPLDRHRGLGPLLHRLGRLPEAAEGAVHLIDQRRQITQRNVVMGACAATICTVNFRVSSAVPCCSPTEVSPAIPVLLIESMSDCCRSRSASPGFRKLLRVIHAEPLFLLQQLGSRGSFIVRSTPHCPAAFPGAGDPPGPSAEEATGTRHRRNGTGRWRAPWRVSRQRRPSCRPGPATRFR